MRRTLSGIDTGDTPSCIGAALCRLTYDASFTCSGLKSTGTRIQTSFHRHLIHTHIRTGDIGAPFGMRTGTVIVRTIHTGDGSETTQFWIGTGWRRDSICAIIALGQCEGDGGREQKASEEEQEAPEDDELHW